MVKVTQLPLNQRPRERALALGLSALSNEEILALILKHGTKTHSLYEQIDLILEKAKSFSNLVHLTVYDLMEIPGIKSARALELAAIFELVKRVEKHKIEHRNLMNRPDFVAKWCQHEIGLLKQECLLAIYLSTIGEMVGYEIVFKGTLNHSVIHPREIFHGAIMNRAASIILVHNHPSGSLIPSRMDIKVTKIILKCSELLQIPLVDHLIVTEKDYCSIFSYLEENDHDLTN